jgi:hypothetical protein
MLESLISHLAFVLLDYINAATKIIAVVMREIERC